MKSRYKIIALLAVASIISCKGNAQVILWNSLKKEYKHILNTNLAWDYGINYGVGYAYQLKFKCPILLDVEFSVPSGKNLLDDYKTKMGGQVKLHEYQNFILAIKIQGIFRRYENPSVRIINFGSEMSTTFGYYKPTWFLASEIGFDKAIVSYFKHSKLIKDNFTNIRDGWYEPSTGGNFYYGFQTGFTFKKHDIYLKIGKIVTQDFKTTPLIPYYTQVGYNIKIGK